MHAPLPMSELRNPSHVTWWIAPPPSSGPSGAPPYRPSREGAGADPAYELHRTELCTVYVILHFVGLCCRAPGTLYCCARAVFPRRHACRAAMEPPSRKWRWLACRMVSTAVASTVSTTIHFFFKSCSATKRSFSSFLYVQKARALCRCASLLASDCWK